MLSRVISPNSVTAPRHRVADAAVFNRQETSSESCQCPRSWECGSGSASTCAFPWEESEGTQKQPYFMVESSARAGVQLRWVAKAFHRRAAPLPGSVVCPVGWLVQLQAHKVLHSPSGGVYSKGMSNCYRSGLVLFCFLTSTPPLPGEKSKLKAPQSRSYVSWIWKREWGTHTVGRAAGEGEDPRAQWGSCLAGGAWEKRRCRQCWKGKILKGLEG